MNVCKKRRSENIKKYYFIISLFHKYPNISLRITLLENFSSFPVRLNWEI